MGEKVDTYMVWRLMVASLRTDIQITFSLHFTPLGIRLSSLVAEPGAFLVLETILLGYYSTHC